MSAWLNYHHLYYFRTIATEGSIAKASEKLRLGAPTLSAQLKLFEDHLGVRLFDRRHKKLILTETGKVALHYANEIFKMGGEMVEALNDRLIPNRVHVQIGILDSVPKKFGLNIIKAARELEPCRLSILEGKGDELLRELLHHRLDLFVSNYSSSPVEAPGLHSRLVAKLPVHLYGRPKFKALKRNFPQSLSLSPIILPTSHSKLRHDLDEYFRSRSIGPDPIAETQDTSLQILLGLEEIGLVPATALTVESYTSSKELIKIGDLTGVYEEYYFITAQRKIENRVASELFKHFKV